MNGINQKASSERPSRSFYRGRKLKNHKTIHQDEVQQPESADFKDRPIQSKEKHMEVGGKKVRQPNMHFNLNFMIQKRKTFNGDFSREQNITGTSYPYYNYFSSSKSSVPSTQRSSRYKTPRRASEITTAKTMEERSRFTSTTVGVRKGQIC